MSNMNPKTIVITTIPGKRPISAMLHSPNANNILDNDDESDEGPHYNENGSKKRRRLTHLTPDQRMMRRKLKNRVAAQTARDRKKMRMQELEEAVAALEAENKRLQNENSTLKQQTGALSSENQVLRVQLRQTPCEGAQSDKDGPLKSAALRSPLPQEKAHLVRQAASQYLALLITLSLTSWVSSNKSSKAPNQLSSRMIKSSPRIASLLSSVVKTTHQQWWGPQQQSWNPSKN